MAETDVLAWRIDRGRLERSIEELGRIGATPRGGLTRLALTDEDRRGRDQMVAWMREAGLRITVDRMGNIFGERAGSVPGLPPVMMGSHVDSVPTGGRYDGQLGVLCGLEAIRALNEHAVRTRHPVTLVIFTNEEGARFQPAMIASGVMAGKIALEDAYNARDRDGIRLVDELERIGYLGPEPCVARPMRAYLELHIEQGPFLEEEGLSVGVVEGIVAIAWSRLTITGVQDHAGPTPMRIRHDALVAAAEVVAGARRIATEIGGDLVTTVGTLAVTPNIVNAIPGRVAMSIDMRDPRDAALDRARDMLDELVRAACAREGVTYELEHYWRVPCTAFTPDVIAAVERAARATGARFHRIRSGAGHDAQYMAAIGPTGMIFVPSHEGRSHCEEEFTAIEDIEDGANTLFLAALDLAERA
ncbi:MAG: Zn-dependent hydrolase [Candidatus Rokubacteria bacterium]|nr:Zn-dependent hydrolase [Candidatus Rokubacteria bacterium]MBI3827101.1 Zn-dependent hydrolase [Candidatus Rokubacteria bacterium]